VTVRHDDVTDQVPTMSPPQGATSVQPPPAPPPSEPLVPPVAPELPCVELQPAAIIAITLQA
jgi:hypothetical protein